MTNRSQPFAVDSPAISGDGFNKRNARRRVKDKRLRGFFERRVTLFIFRALQVFICSTTR